jgi:hypothetical protein
MTTHLKITDKKKEIAEEQIRHQKKKEIASTLR